MKKLTVVKISPATQVKRVERVKYKKKDLGQIVEGDYVNTLVYYTLSDNLGSGFIEERLINNVISQMKEKFVQMYEKYKKEIEFIENL